MLLDVCFVGYFSKNHTFIRRYMIFADVSDSPNTDISLPSNQRNVCSLNNSLDTPALLAVIVEAIGASKAAIAVLKGHTSSTQVVQRRRLSRLCNRLLQPSPSAATTGVLYALSLTVDTECTTTAFYTLLLYVWLSSLLLERDPNNS